MQVVDSTFPSKDGRKVLAASIQKKGNNKAYTYTHKLDLEVAGQPLQRKRAITAAEFIELEQ